MVKTPLSCTHSIKNARIHTSTTWEELIKFPRHWSPKSWTEFYSLSKGTIRDPMIPHPEKTSPFLRHCLPFLHAIHFLRKKQQQWKNNLLPGKFLCLLQDQAREPAPCSLCGVFLVFLLYLSLCSNVYLSPLFKRVIM